MEFRPRIYTAALALIVGLSCPVSEAQSPKPGKTAPKATAADALGARIKALEAELDTARGELQSRPATRFQMLKAGERVVILDTETGKTQIIDPEPQTALQKVDVGRAWVVVTVLGNASIRSRPLPSPPPPLPED